MVTIYSKKNCPFCDKAKRLLTLKKVGYVEVMVDEKPEAQEFLIKEGHRSVPQIYKDGRLAVEGGYVGLASKSEDFFDTLKG